MYPLKNNPLGVFPHCPLYSPVRPIPERLPSTPICRRRLGCVSIFAAATISSSDSVLNHPRKRGPAHHELCPAPCLCRAADDANGIYKGAGYLLLYHFLVKWIEHNPTSCHGLASYSPPSFLFCILCSRREPVKRRGLLSCHWNLGTR
ncbi:hypothetical protein LZ32DRAFT_369927 [Colletotrichum eremochloae]|nr:hypothetical protein LZ32DRAFT_369927 [Colletotrichum eremochloae]